MLLYVLTGTRTGGRSQSLLKTETASRVVDQKQQHRHVHTHRRVRARWMEGVYKT